MMSAGRLAPRARWINDSLMRRSYIVGVGLALTLTAGLVAASGAIADGSPPFGSPGTVTTIFFEPSHHRPVAGQVFTALVVVDTLATSGDGFTANCGQAVLGRKHWYGSQRSFFIGGDRDAVVCSWRIPARSAGRRFRVVYASASTATGVTYPYWTYSWRVRR
jgi:hypothetical protein